MPGALRRPRVQRPGCPAATWRLAAWAATSCVLQDLAGLAERGDLAWAPTARVNYVEGGARCPSLFCCHPSPLLVSLLLEAVFSR